VPFLFFTDHRDELAAQVREGRRNEFASFAGFADPARRARIPDPNAPATFTASDPQQDADTPHAEAWRRWFAALLRLRRERLLPRLAQVRSLGSEVIGARAVRARWRLADESILELAANFDEEACEVVPASAGEALYICSPAGDALDQQADGRLPGWTLIARLLPPATSP
jgi:maltooligosyltrehalose trehalohydrolase